MPIASPKVRIEISNKRWKEGKRGKEEFLLPFVAYNF